MSFRVVEIIDGDTFKVTPDWEWNNKRGNIVRPIGYNTPEEGQPGYQEARIKLRTLILWKDVELRDPIEITYDRLLCDVYYNSRNLADYFLAYR